MSDPPISPGEGRKRKTNNKTNKHVICKSCKTPRSASGSQIERTKDAAEDMDTYGPKPNGTDKNTIICKQELVKKGHPSLLLK
jgi:hypothetical protein